MMSKKVRIICLFHMEVVNLPNKDKSTIDKYAVC